MKKFKVTFLAGESAIDTPAVVHEVYAETPGDAYSKANELNLNNPDFRYWHYYSMPEIEEVVIYGLQFDWYTELRKAQKISDAYKKGKVSQGFYYDFRDGLSEKSGSWTTCACGNACSIIPRTPFGEPIDMTLRHLGMDFHGWVEIGKNYGTAIQVLDLIEARSKVLIEEELVKLKDQSYVPPTDYDDQLTF